MTALALTLVAVAAVVAVVVAAAARRSGARVARDLQRLAGRVDPTGRSPEVTDLDGLAEVVRATSESARGMELELRRLRLAVDALDLGVVVADADGTVVLRNPVARGFHESRHSEAVAEQALDAVLEEALGGATQQREVELFGPPARTLLLRALPLRAEGTPLGAVAFVSDVTEARRVDRVRQDFVAAVSHELKTPIGALALLAETIMDEEDAVVTSQLADRVVKEAERLARLVDDLLDLSFVEGQESPRREPVPVHLVLHEALALVRPAAHAAGVPIEVAPVSSDLELVCDRRQVVSALRNLLDNAVKYSEAGAPVRLDVSVDPAGMVVAVRDQGIGIPRRDLARIFERFYRVDRARSRETGGTGLGLSIVRHVAAAHGGEVSVDSVEGEGSVFRVRFPATALGPERLSDVS